MTREEMLAMAKQFHAAYERLAPTYGYVTNRGTRVFDEGSPNGQLMVAVVAEVGGAIERRAYERSAKLIEDNFFDDDDKRAAAIRALAGKEGE